MPPRQRKGKTSGAMRKQSGAKPIPLLGFQAPPVVAIDTFLHHRSGCKKASTYGKMNLPSVAAVKGSGHDINIKVLTLL